MVEYVVAAEFPGIEMDAALHGSDADGQVNARNPEPRNPLEDLVHHL
jgi:hypothetical protein